jgi:hypothetical protein
MYQKAYDNYEINQLSPDLQLEFLDQKDKFERERQLLESEDAFELDYSLSAAISYNIVQKPTYNIKITAFAENILNSKKRNYVSTGSKFFYPERLQFMQEPQSLGLRLTVSYF